MARVISAPDSKKRKEKRKKESLAFFRYVALTADGRTVKGRVKATNEIAASNSLFQGGLTPVNMEMIASPFSLEGALPSMFGAKPRDVIIFSNQLATLLDAGISLLPALQLLQGQGAVGKPFRRIIAALAQDLGTGKSFAQAIARHHKVFSDLYIRTVGIGEQVGKLEPVLRQLAEYQEKQTVFAKKLVGALTYPAIMVVMGAIVGFILLTVALPPLTKVFLTVNVPLPLPTRILMALSSFMKTFMLQILVGVAVLIPTSIVVLKRPWGRRLLDRVRLNAPIIGQPVLMGELARFSSTMAMMLNAGLSLQDIVEALPQTTKNTVFQDALNHVKDGLFLGQGLSYPMATSGVFPGLMLQMVRVGEESNSLEQNMRALAAFYEQNAAERINMMVALISPLSTVVIGILAGFIALSVIMPMYSITAVFE